MNTGLSATLPSHKTQPEALSTQPRKLRSQAQKRHWQKCLPLLNLAGHSQWHTFSRQLNRLDQDDFLSFLNTHDLNDAFYWMMQRDDAGAQLPSWFLLHLLAAHKWGEQRRSDLIAALVEFKQHAQVAGLDFMLLKGLDFSQRFYGDLNARQVRDIDVLVSPGSDQAFVNLLTQLGYEIEGAPAISRWIPSSLKHRLEHAQTWQRGHISIDLHHSPRVRPAYRIVPEKLFSRAINTAICNEHYQVPADADALTMLVLSLGTDIEQGLVKARSLVDIETAFESMAADFDWSAWLAQLKELGLLALSVAVLGLVRGALPGQRAWPGWLKKAHCPIMAEQSETSVTLLSALPYKLSNRRWFLRHHSGSTPMYLAWWLMGGFFREGSLGRLSGSLRDRG